MARLLPLLICSVLVFATNSVVGSNEQITANVEIIRSEAAFLKANPSAKLLIPELKKSIAPGPESKVVLAYKVGERKDGDGLLTSTANWFTYESPQDVKATLTYPSSGTGGEVTFVQIDVEQSTDGGKAYITDGGIGQRKITIIVESSNTLYFRYKETVYGKK